jgi:hypothetical protein
MPASATSHRVCRTAGAISAIRRISRSLARSESISPARRSHPGMPEPVGAARSTRHRATGRCASRSIAKAPATSRRGGSLPSRHLVPTGRGAATAEEDISRSARGQARDARARRPRRLPYSRSAAGSCPGRGDPRAGARRRRRAPDHKPAQQRIPCSSPSQGRPVELSFTIEGYRVPARWSMRSWASVRCRPNRRRGFPRSHGSSGRTANDPMANVRLTSPVEPGQGAEPWRMRLGRTAVGQARS